jgi:hypothetical protein
MLVTRCTIKKSVLILDTDIFTSTSILHTCLRFDILMLKGRRKSEERN